MVFQKCAGRFKVVLFHELFRTLKVASKNGLSQRELTSTFTELSENLNRFLHGDILHNLCKYL